MNYGIMLLSLGLALFLLVNLIGSGIALLAIRLARKRLTEFSAVKRARMFFILGTCPAATALGAVLLILLPSFLAFEPRSTLEVPGISLTILAFCSIIAIFWAAARCFSRWLATRRLMNQWMKRAELVEFHGVNGICYRIEHPFPLVAIVGAFKPRLFIARKVIASLTQPELEAAFAHERGHLSGSDNLRRWILAICRDLLPFLPRLGSIQKQWSATAEAVADQYASHAGQGLDLASALVKIARLIPTGAAPIAPAAALLVDENTTLLASRVQSLLEDASQKEGREIDRRTPPSAPIVMWVFGAVLALGIVVATQPGLLARVHTAIEDAVGILK